MYTMTDAHDCVTGLIAERLALSRGFSNEAAARVRFAANFHDIGKSKIPGAILNKPGNLTGNEFDVVKLHTAYGYTMLKAIKGKTADMARLTALCHHERWDGGGYWGIAGKRQPLYVRIVAIADVFTALIAERPYKPAWAPEDAIRYIGENAGSQFDPHLAELFIPLAREFDFQGLGA
jgi:putative two-component system response regulator